jgi:predicted RNA binding protein YcfA (HicA-like mRNA interferase family)
MPKRPGINHQHAVRALEQAGFRMVRQGNHSVMSDGVRILTVPRHNPINAITMGGIVRDGGLTIEEFRALLSRPRPRTKRWSGRGKPRRSAFALICLPRSRVGSHLCEVFRRLFDRRALEEPEPVHPTGEPAASRGCVPTLRASVGCRPHARPKEAGRSRA